MADDLVISLSAETQDFLRDMKASSEQMKRLGDQGQKTNSLLSNIKWSMGANQLGVMLQDMTTVYEAGGKASQVIAAGSNNLIQFATLAHPAAGAVTAIGIAAYQLNSALDGSAARAKKLKEEAEAAAKASREIGSSYLTGIGRGSVIKDQREAYAVKERLLQDIEVAKAKVEAAQGMHAGTPGQEIVKKGLVAESEREVQKLNAELSAISKVTKDLPNKAAGFDEFGQMVNTRTKGVIDDLRAMSLEFSGLNREQRDNALLTAELNKLRSDASYSENIEHVKEYKSEMEKLLELRREVEAANVNKEANAASEAYRRQKDQERRDAIQSVRDANLTAREKFDIRAGDIGAMMRDGLSEGDARKALMRDAAQAWMTSGPQLSASLTKGSIEEESFRNRQEAAKRQEQFAKTMVDRIVTAIKGIDKPRTPDTVGY